MLVAVVDGHDDARLYFHEAPNGAGVFHFSARHSNTNQILATIAAAYPDLALVEIRLPGVNSAECAARLKLINPHLEVIMVSPTAASPLGKASLPAGAEVCPTKYTTLNQGQAALNFFIAEDRDAQPRKSFAETQPLNRPALSPREEQVMRNIAEGLLYKEIAVKLGVSFSAVHKMQHKIFRKLRVANRTEATRKWLDLVSQRS